MGKRKNRQITEAALPYYAPRHVYALYLADELISPHWEIGFMEPNQSAYIEAMSVCAINRI